MDYALLGGCATGGAVVGAVLDRVAVAAAARPSTVGTASETAIGAGPPTSLPAEPAAVAGPPDAAATDAAAGGAAAGPVVGGGAAGVGLERAGVAVVTAGLFVLAGARLGAVPELGAYCALFAGLVALSVVDIRAGLVPRKILYPTLVAMGVGLVGAAAADHAWGRLLDGAIGGGGAFGVFFAIWWLFPKGMGFGDVRLAGLIGAGLGYLGFSQLYVGFLVGFVTGSLIGVVKMGVQGTGRKTALPFGPALAVGAVVGVLWGGALAGLWLHGGV